MNKSENFTPGFICVLHTFGRSLQWNPHIHVLLSEGASGNNSVWRNVKHFNYAFLRNSFRLVLLNILEKHLGSSFKRVKAYIYKHCPNGFYVYAKPTLTNNILAVPIEKRRFLESLNSWRTSLLLSFGFDPLLCKCGHHMTVLEICHKGSPLIEMYRKILNSS